MSTVEDKLTVLAGERRVDVLDCFVARCDARGYLWAAGEYELQEAVDALQHDAERDGLDERIGADAVQAILACAFAAYQEAEHG